MAAASENISVGSKRKAEDESPVATTKAKTASSFSPLQTSKIFYSASGIEIIVNPFLVGEPLLKKAHQVGTDFLTLLQSEIPNLSQKNICILDILMGGRFYGLYDVFTQGMPEAQNIRHSEVRAKRRCEEGKWSVRVWHDEENSTMSEAQAWENMEQSDTLIIGDTIGTGTTLKGMLGHLGKTIKNAKNLDIIIYTICGSDICEEKLKQVQHLFKSVSLYYANAKFKLNENGTYLEFVNAKYNSQSQQEISELIGTFAPKMQCAVWDWGDRFTKIEHHLQNVTEYYQNIDGEIPSCIGFDKKVVVEN